jgi:hypothetical protein
MIKSRRIRWAGYVAVMGNKRNTYVLVGKLEGRGPLRRPRRRGVDSIKKDVGEIGWGGIDWIRLTKIRDKRRALVNALINLRFP